MGMRRHSDRFPPDMIAACLDAYVKVDPLPALDPEAMAAAMDAALRWPLADLVNHRAASPNQEAGYWNARREWGL